MNGEGGESIEALLKCRHPIVLAGMGGVARSELVAAVTEAGGFGFLGMVREPIALIRREVEALRRLGHERFGVNIIPAATEKDLLDRQIGTIIDLGVPAVMLFWEVDAGVVRRFRDAGVMVIYQVGSPEEARVAERAGAQAIIAQGVEAGGHVRGTTPLRRLLPAVRRAVAVPVLAAGGLATGADLVTARALGAAGVVLGTSLIAATESFAHAHHRQRLIAAKPGDTLLTDTFHVNWPDGAMVRVLSSSVTAGERGVPRERASEVIGEEEGRSIYLFSTDSPLRSMSGDFEAMALYAGTGVGEVTTVRPAAAIIGEIVAEAKGLLEGQAGAGEEIGRSASPVCYAGEMGGAYMGFIDDAEMATEVSNLVGLLARGLAATLESQGEEASRPPFASVDLRYARHIVTLRPFAGGVDVKSDQKTDIAPSVLPAAIVQRARALVPRLPENACRRKLLALARDFETDVEFPIV